MDQKKELEDVAPVVGVLLLVYVMRMLKGFGSVAPMGAAVKKNAAHFPIVSRKIRPLSLPYGSSVFGDPSLARVSLHPKVEDWLSHVTSFDYQWLTPSRRSGRVKS